MLSAWCAAERYGESKGVSITGKQQVYRKIRSFECNIRFRLKLPAQVDNVRETEQSKQLNRLASGTNNSSHLHLVPHAELNHLAVSRARYLQ